MVVAPQATPWMWNDHRGVGGQHVAVALLMVCDRVCVGASPAGMTTPGVPSGARDDRGHARVGVVLVGAVGGGEEDLAHVEDEDRPVALV